MCKAGRGGLWLGGSPKQSIRVESSTADAYGGRACRAGIRAPWTLVLISRRVSTRHGEKITETHCLFFFRKHRRRGSFFAALALPSGAF